MIYAQERKLANVIVPEALTSAGTATGTVDLKDFDYCQLIWHIATATAVEVVPLTCKVEESDDLTNYSAIVPLTGGSATSTSVGFVIPPGHVTVEQLYAMNIDCRGRKRYLKTSLCPGTNQIEYVVAVLDRAKVMPDTTTEAGVALLVNA
jgi:hypothetical protein